MFTTLERTPPMVWCDEHEAKLLKRPINEWLATEKADLDQEEVDDDKTVPIKMGRAMKTADVR